VDLDVLICTDRSDLALPFGLQRTRQTDEAGRDGSRHSMSISRRRFLQGSAAGVGLLAARANAQRSLVAEQVDALVIGSGFGGAIAALRLAEAGINTVVLERGKRWPITPAGDTFCTFQKPDGRAGWLSPIATGLDPTPIPIYTGVMELISANGITVRTGAGVGGGSLAYNAIMLQPSEKLFKMVFPSAISYEELDVVYYPRVRAMLGQSVIPPDILATSYYLSTRVNVEQSENAGFINRPVEINVNWKIVREEIAGRRVPSAIAGQSWFGLNSGAKNSVDHNYLPMAEKTGRVEVLPLHVVTDISQSRADGPYTVTVNHIDTNGSVLRTKAFSTKRLFMGAGSCGTSALLTKARDKGTLPSLSQAVGKGWGNNGDFIAFREGLNGGNNNAGQGGPCGHILMQDENNPYSPTNMVELVTPASDAFPGASLYVGLGLAPAVGYWTYDPVTDSASLTWPGSNPALSNWANGAQSLVNTINTANPGTSNAFYGNNLTAHPVGGVNAGTVCDMYGRVKGHPGLYVVDGAFIPGGSVGGVNPSFTIAALAERSMDNIVARDLC
jgi:cholesterol oxidase